MNGSIEQRVRNILKRIAVVGQTPNRSSIRGALSQERSNARPRSTLTAICTVIQIIQVGCSDLSIEFGRWKVLENTALLGE